MYLSFFLALLCFNAALLVNAGLYIVDPRQGSTCQANQPCKISWLDDGSRPLLDDIGVVSVGLYTGRQQLVQTIAPVDVRGSLSISFIPNPEAGPNSDTYYISLTSTTLKGNDSIPYSGFSPYFRLTGMSGSFDRPLPAATQSIPVPATVTRSQGTLLTSTITVGRAPTSSATASPPPSSAAPSPSSVMSAVTTESRLSSVRSSSSVPTSSPTTAPATGGAVGLSTPWITLPVFLVPIVSAFAIL